MIVVEGDIFVIALNQAAAGRVVTRDGQQHGGIFAEWKLGLNKAFAEAGLADYQAAIVILHRARYDFGG